MGDLFDLKISGHFYTRLSNPTLEAVENKIAELEGGVGCVLTASGQSASFLSIINICKAGDHVVCSSAIYGGTFNLFNKTLRDMGVDFTFISPDCTEAEFDSAFKKNTKAVFAETLSNPSLAVLDIELFARVAHEHGVPLIIDNTFPTPINCRPFEFGADIIIHSTTKYMDGHACSLGGAVVDSGNFNWKNGKFPQFTEPDETYHGIVYTDHFGKAAYIAKLRVHLIRDIGPTMSPNNAFLLNLGLETLFLRMERHCANAMEVAKYLSANEKVAWVNYPDLEGNKYNAKCKKYLPKGSSGVIAFGLKGGKQAAIDFMEKLKLFAIVTHVADVRSCVLHPASTTHKQLSEEQLIEAGVSSDLIRLSVGIEYIGDILDDIKQAIDSI
jgi:O-acetylhomoserine (thiol)-lyase